MMENAIAVQENRPLSVIGLAMSETEIRAQVSLIQRVMKAVMKDGEHFGLIPGCGKKPALLKAGAEKLSMMFRFAPEYEITMTDLPGGHREYRVVTRLTHITTGLFLGEGVGTCSTMEGKYRYRVGEVTFTGKSVPKEYWDNRDAALIGGRGFGVKKNESGKWEIVRVGEKIEHDNPADYFNTCLKMAKKRSLVDAVLTATAASDIFTQDIDDDPALYGGGSPAPVPVETEGGKEDAPEEGPTTGDFADPEYQKRREIYDWGMALVHGDSEEYAKLIARESAFTGKDGAIQSRDSETKLKGKWLNKVHHQIKTLYEKTYHADSTGSASSQANGLPTSSVAVENKGAQKDTLQDGLPF